MFKGSFKIVKKLTDTGEITYDGGWQDNVVTEYAISQFGIKDLFSTAPNSNLTYNILGTCDIFTSSDNVLHTSDNHVFHRDIRIATDVPAISSVTDIKGDGINTPFFIEFAGQFLPPGTDQTIRCLGLARTANTTVQLSPAWTQINPEIIQTTLETLIVFYRLEFATRPNQGLGKISDANFFTNKTRQFENHNTSLNGYYPLYGKDYWLSLKEPPELGMNSYGLSNRSNWWIANPSSNKSVSSRVLNRPFYSTALATHNGRATDTTIGKIVGGIHFNTTNGAGANPHAIWKRLLNAEDNKTQNFYAHTPTKTVPFFNALDIASSNGLIDINSTAWIDSDWPNYYRVEFSGTGGVGVSEYNFMKRNITGFDGNFHDPRAEVVYMHHEWAGAHPIAVTGGFPDSAWGGPFFTMAKDNINGFCGPRSSFGDVPTFYDKHTMILCDNSGMVLYDMTDPEAYVFTSATYNNFTPTKIGQIAHDELSDTIWVSCAETGLYKVENPTLDRFGGATITPQAISLVSGSAGPMLNQCYAVSLGRDLGGFRAVFAMAEGGLIRSLDNGATWEAYDNTSVGIKFTHATIEADWSRTLGMKTDKNHPDDRLMIMYHQDTVINDTLQTYGTWWDTVNDASDLGQKLGGGFTDATGFYVRSNVDGVFANITDMQEVRRNVSKWFDCSPKQGHWVTGNARHAATGTNRRPLRLDYGFTIDSSAQSWDSDTHGNVFSNAATNWNVYGTTENSYQPDNILYPTIDDNGNDCLIQQDAGFEWWKLPLDMSPPIKLQNDTVAKVLIPGAGITLQPSTTYGFYARHAGEQATAMGWRDSAALQSELWERYVWSGSDWTLRDSDGIAYTTKPTHASVDSAVDNLLISFDDTAGSRSFQDGEYYSNSIVNGVHMDNNTDYDWTGVLHTSRPVAKNVTDKTNATVPASSFGPLVSISVDSADCWTSTGGIDRVFYGGTDAINFAYGFYLPGTIKWRGTDKISTNDDFFLRMTSDARLGNFGFQGSAYVRPHYTGVIGSAQFIGDSAQGYGASGLEPDYGWLFDNGAVSFIEKGQEVYYDNAPGINDVTQVTLDANRPHYYTKNLPAYVDTNSYVPNKGQYVKDLFQKYDLKRTTNTVEWYFEGELVRTSALTSDSDMVPWAGTVMSGSFTSATFDVNLLDWKTRSNGCWVRVGDSDQNSGAFEPEFKVLQCVTPEAYSVSLDGEKIVATPNALTPSKSLASGTASIHPEDGWIRFSDSDVGKTIDTNFDIILKK